MRRIFLVLFFSFQAVFATQMAEVLLLHSYNKGLKWSDGITDGIKSVFDKYPQYELTTEYMDSKKITSAGYFQTLLSLYKQKFSNRNYKAIIVADNYAFEFALEHADELFPDVPIIFCGVENFDPIQIHIHQASYKTTDRKSVV